MTSLLIVLNIILFVALLAVAIELRRVRRSIPSQIQGGIDGAIREFKKRSGRTRVATTVEQLVPFVREMPFDPSDLRILSGGPIDYVVFDGLSDGEVRELVFLDIKTGSKPKATKEQKQVQRCADLGRVRFALFEVDEDGEATYLPSKRVDEILGVVDEETRKKLRLPE